MDTSQNISQSEFDTAPSIQDMAGLMDLNLESDDPVSNSYHSEKSTEFEDSNYSDVEEAELVDQNNEAFDNEEFNPEKNRTKVSLQHNGLAKAFLVGGAGLAVVVGGLTFFQGQLPKEQVAQVIKKKDPIEDKVSSAQAATNKAQQSESETKAQLALSKQKDSLAQAKQSEQSKENAPEKITVATSDNSTPVVVAPIKTPTSNLVPIVTPVSSVAKAVVVAPVKPQPVVVASVQKKPIPAVSIASSLPVSNIQPEVQLIASKSFQKSGGKTINAPGMGTPLASNTVFDRAPATINKPLDDSTELQQLASIGRYGTVATAVEVPPPPLLNPDNRLNSLRSNGPLALAPTSNLPPLSQYFQNYASQETPTTAFNNSSASESKGARTAFSNQRNSYGTKSIDKEPLKETTSETLADKNSVVNNKIAEAPISITTLLVGTSAKGSTLTPILWGAGANNTAKFVLKLDEPMLDGNNREAFPAGTQFVVTAKPASTAIGIAELEVVSTIIKGMEFAPLPGSIVIRDDQGGLLIGEDFFKRDEHTANRDLMGIFTGALGNVGRILNQPNNTFSSNVNGNFSSTSSVVTNRDPNIFGAVLEGGFKDLSSVWSQRNQQAIQELAGKPNVYQIPKGRGIRVFINQSMTF
jgi:hypothetical protein